MPKCTTVELDATRGTMPAHLCVPEGVGPWPGVVVAHDAAGMTRDLREQTEWLASEGFLALAPDLFYWGGRWQCLFAYIRSATQPLGELDRCRRWLASHPQCSGPVGIIGFCMGGGYALMLAADHEFAVASVNYGAPTPEARASLVRACPIVGSFGGRDRWPGMRSAPGTIDRILTQAGIEHDIRVYPEAGHGFLNTHRLEELTPFDGVIARLANAAHDEESAADARERILAFFRKHLAFRTS